MRSTYCHRITRGGIFEQRPQRERRHDTLASRRTAPPTSTDSTRPGPLLLLRLSVGFQIELDVVDADDLPPVHVDDFIDRGSKVAFEQQDAVRIANGPHVVDASPVRMMAP